MSVNYDVGYYGWSGQHCVTFYIGSLIRGSYAHTHQSLEEIYFEFKDLEAKLIHWLHKMFVIDIKISLIKKKKKRYK